MLRTAKHQNRSVRQQIERGLAGEGDPTTLAGWIAARLAVAMSAPGGPPAGWLDAFRRLLLVTVQPRCTLAGRPLSLDALSRLAVAQPDWRRQPETWLTRTHNAPRQFAALARHLLADYPVPAWLDQAWLEDGPLCAAGRGWYAHVGRGQNLRTAAGLPFPLTRRMAHIAAFSEGRAGGPPTLTLRQVMLQRLRSRVLDGPYPPRLDLNLPQMLRWAQLIGLGVDPAVALAAVATRLGLPSPDEPFWLTFGHFLANFPMLAPSEVGPIVDFLFAQRFDPIGGVYDPATATHQEAGPPQPRLSLKGRTAASLLRQVHGWHGRLAHGADTPEARRAVWETSGIPGFDRVEGDSGDPRRFVVVELLSAADLMAEGRDMRHCVYSYAGRCTFGYSAIFSLRRDDGTGKGLERRVTVEVTPQPKPTIVQIRGPRNTAPDPADLHVLRGWAAAAGLTIKETA